MEKIEYKSRKRSTTHQVCRSLFPALRINLHFGEYEVHYLAMGPAKATKSVRNSSANRKSPCYAYLYLLSGSE